MADISPKKEEKVEDCVDPTLEEIIKRSGYALHEEVGGGFINSGQCDRCVNLRADMAEHDYRKNPSVSLLYSIMHNGSRYTLSLGAFPRVMLFAPNTKDLLEKDSAREKAYFVAYRAGMTDDFDRFITIVSLLVCGETDYKTILDFVDSGRSEKVVAALQSLFNDYTKSSLIPPSRSIAVIKDYKLDYFKRK